MSEWPDGWFRDGRGQAGAAPGAGPADPTVHLPAGGTPAGSPPGDAGGREAPWPPAPAGPGPSSQGRPAGGWPEQPPPTRQPGQPGQPGRQPGQPAAGRPGGRPPRSGAGIGVPGTGTGTGTGGFRRWLRPRRILAVLAIAVSVVLILVVGTYFFLDSKLHRQDVLVSYAGRPAASAGQNWLIAGSDSRQGLSRKEERKLATGFDVSGQRSDTIMILHIPSNGGPPVLVSLPRDSWVPIPGFGDNKINAAYSLGGPELLAKTVQNVTGLRISHYMGIGFGGFVNVVNAVGGVRMCIKMRLDDPASGLHLHKGCQTLNGDQALGYVRTRHLYANQDLQRVQDQRLFLRALLTKLTSPGVMLNPFAALPAASGAASTLTVDQGTSLYQLVEVAFALRHPETTTVPIANSNFVTPTGEDAVEWDPAQATQLFSALKNDQAVPRDLLTGSRQAG
jgi:LCP family protein required for cell wall assembly